MAIEHYKPADPNVICGALHNLVPLVQFKKCKKHPWRNVKVLVLVKLYKWYQIAQRITYFVQIYEKQVEQIMTQHA